MPTYRVYVSFCLASLAVSLVHACEAECEDAAWLQIHRSTCDPEDLACEAKAMACSLKAMMEEQWPTRSSLHPDLGKIVSQLSSVCEGRNVSLVLTEIPSSSPERVELVDVSWSCSPPSSCTTDVVHYEKQNPGAAYAMSAVEIAASTTISTINDILRTAEVIGVAGSVAFTLMNGFLGAFFPAAGGLPSNPCTYATDDWGKCVWEQVRPFVAKFVDLKIDQTFDELWAATINGYQTRLWALNASAYRDSTHFRNGTIKDMPPKVRTKMFDDMYQLHNQMVGDMSLFLTNHSIQTTAGAYLSQFAALHISVMTNLLGSSAYQTKGNLYVFGTFAMCYAKYVYSRATQAFSARMAALVNKQVNEGTVECCTPFPYGPGPHCVKCPKGHGEFADTWRECSWGKLQYGFGCLPMAAAFGQPYGELAMYQCFEKHRNEVEKQTVAFWRNWLAPVPLWLNNVILMQKIQPAVSNRALEMSQFQCPV